MEASSVITIGCWIGFFIGIPVGVVLRGIMS